jgi:hypothetical protein
LIRGSNLTGSTSGERNPNDNSECIISFYY